MISFDQMNLYGSYLQDHKKKIMIADFIQWASKKIYLSQSPDIYFTRNEREARCHHHTGSYDWHNDKLWVYVGDRNFVDILRTLCHELVHAKQDQEGRIRHKSHPGDKLESEADQVAGYLIKLWGAQHHDIFQ
jgi:Zn-dependent peptidase ImmA (M78 family)